jgi:crotonobetainyl-CoA:carnitine CoA-transferase CaiB-like acyl-CoA transferase
MRGPLTGLRVVDLTQVLSGPYCTMLLADLGADVVKVEPPTGDVARRWGPFVPPPAGAGPDPGTSPEVPPADGYGGYFASVNRNKRSVCLDLKDPTGRERLLTLLAEADVLVENFRVGVMEGLGLPFEELHERFPRLVYASIRGFGDPRTGTSPYAHWPAFDIVAQAMGGIMGVTGSDADHPVKVGPGIGDIFPAALAAVGLLAAVREAEATGEGRYVDVAMYDSVLALTERIVYQHSLLGDSPQPQGNTHPLLCPYGVVRTADGFVTVAAPSDHQWRLLTEIMGRPELGTDPRLSTNEGRLAHAREVYELLEQWTGAVPTDEVVGRLGGRIPCGPVNTAADIARDPHVAARRMIVEVDHPSGGTVEIAGSPIKLAGAEPGGFTPAPRLGEHTDDVVAHGFDGTGADPAPYDTKQVG